MSDLIEKHEPLSDCDCGDCARHERNVLRASFAWLSDWHKVPGQSYRDCGLNFIEWDEEGFFIDDTNLQPVAGIRFTTVADAVAAAMALMPNSK